ncbi:hypothetical protein NQZ68_025273 [Dissostichus eleginoides]|nr:hypothetical protein NQZ68_025273 [Dissostichus eleginoides]
MLPSNPPPFILQARCVASEISRGFWECRSRRGSRSIDRFSVPQPATEEGGVAALEGGGRVSAAPAVEKRTRGGGAGRR